jgi:hypothetical protein
MKKFLFNVGQEYIRLLSIKNIGPVYIGIEYEIVDNKVVLTEIQIQPDLFPYLENLYKLHDQIYRAAENNALSEDLIKQEAKFDIFMEINKHFQL